MTMDALVDRLEIERIDFLKMNIEGAERLAIQGMARTLERTAAVCICCHDFLADSSGDESLRTQTVVVRFLRESGFELAGQPEQRDLPPYVRDQVWAWNPRYALSTAG
jgi:hypothetical protein